MGKQKKHKLTRCPVCKGDGTVKKTTCWRCEGLGKVRQGNG